MHPQFENAQCYVAPQGGAKQGPLLKSSVSHTTALCSQRGATALGPTGGNRLSPSTLVLLSGGASDREDNQKMNDHPGMERQFVK